MRRGLFSIFAFTLLCAFTTADDADTISQLREQLSAFNQKYKRAKIDLQFNQAKYAPGDTALVRILYVSATDLRPIQGGQLIYIDAFDAVGKRVMRSQVLARNGFSSNAIPIPADMEPGIYKLIAYSDWMRNLDPSLFFKSDFIVAGKERLEALAPPSLEFYPEGGTFVANIENSVLIHATGASSSTVTINGPGGQVATVTLDEQQLGQFNFKPAPGAQYDAEMSVNGRTKKVSLPLANSSGFAIAAGNAFDIKVTPGAGINEKDKYFVVVINQSGILFSKQLAAQAETPVVVNLPSELPGGIAQMVIIDEKLNRLAWRTINLKKKSEGIFSVRASKSSYATRETVRLEVEASDKLGNPLQGQFAIRVYNKQLFNNTSNRAAADNLLLYADIAASFKLNGAADEATIHRYLISQDCPWVSFYKTLQQPKYSVKGALTINGKAFFIENETPVPDSTLMVFFLQKQTAGYEVTTNKQGEFSCPILFDFAGQEQIFYSATRKGSDLHDITIRLTPSDSIYSAQAMPTKSNGEDPYGNYELKRQLIGQSYSYFSRTKDRVDSLYDPNAIIEDELQGADMTLRVSDYVLFPTMVDLVREVLRSVEYRKIRGRDVVRVYTTGKRPTNDAGPLYVIDGILTKNATTFMNLKPAEIITIKLIKDSNKLRKFGSLGANGVLLVRTKNATRKAALLQENTFSMEGIAPQTKSIIIPPQSDRPDLRPTLYWNAQVKFDVAGKGILEFKASDDVGTFLVELEGVSNDGVLMSTQGTFDVKFNPQP